MFGSSRLIAASLRHYWRTHLAVAGTVVVTTAVLTGALLVGDSMRGSLRSLAIERLGRIDRVLLAERFFRAELAEQITPDNGNGTIDAQAAILLPVAVDHADPDQPARANDVQLLGIEPGFWNLGVGAAGVPPEQRPHPDPLPGGEGTTSHRASLAAKWQSIAPGCLVLNRAAAQRLGARPGDELLLRLPLSSAIPEETPLGRRGRGVRTVRVELTGVVPDRGPGRFGLRPTQRRPLNAYVDRQWLAAQLDQPARANAILLAGPEADRPMPDEQAEPIARRLDPALTDYGLRLEKTPRGYFNLTSERLLISPRMERAIADRLRRRARESRGATGVSPVRRPHPDPLPEGEGTMSSRASPAAVEVQPALTYLAGTIAAGSRAIPYSTVTAIDFARREPLGPWLSVDGEPIPALEPGEIVLNRWAAEELDASPGDRVRLDYFEPATLEADPAERSETFRLVAVAAMEGAAVDRELVPRVPGVTDELTMADWDPPFPFDAGRVRDRDEQYWEQYGPTPKAFVSLDEGRRLWGSRFGRTTSLRIVARQGIDRRELARAVTPRPADVGWRFQPVKRRALEAAGGTTPFGVLFLGFSFFLIAAAVMLTAMLFRLGVTTRAAELGLLTTVGLRRTAIVRLLLGEALPVALAGGLLGVLAGVGYAAVMLLGLRTWWQAAVAMPLLRLHVAPASLALGAAAGAITG
ncbi:MAG: ABC transporter permease, partial [Pirellulales bacterium]